MQVLDRIPALPEASIERASRESRPSEDQRTDPRRTLLFGALAVAVLSWVALYNGYPTVFPDTGSYLMTGAFHIALGPFRAPGYSAFTRGTSLGLSAWFTIGAQAIVILITLHETLKYLISGGTTYFDRCMLACVSVLATLTSLPWLVSMLMPDVFAGTILLSGFLLSFAGELRLITRIFLASILMVSVAAHTSFFPIAALYVAAVFVLRVAGPKPRGLPPARSAAAWLLIPILAAGIWTANQNRRMGLGFRLSPSKNAFLLARLFGDGLAPDFLRENCPKRPYISCRYLSHLPRSEEEFMFQHPLVRDLAGHEDEMEAIVRGTLLAYPQRFLLSSAKQTWLQLAALRTGEEMRSHAGTDWNLVVIHRVLPGDFSAFCGARQFYDRLLPLANAVAPIHTTIFWISVAACLAFAWTRRFRRIDALFASALIFLVINAAVCGALVGVYDRYQSRVAWVMPLCLTAYLCSWMQQRKRGEGVHRPISP
jgi:hypothetical protein